MYIASLSLRRGYELQKSSAATNHGIIEAVTLIPTENTSLKILPGRSNICLVEHYCRDTSCYCLAARSTIVLLIIEPRTTRVMVGPDCTCIYHCRSANGRRGKRVEEARVHLPLHILAPNNMGRAPTSPSPDRGQDS